MQLCRRKGAICCWLAADQLPFRLSHRYRHLLVVALWCWCLMQPAVACIQISTLIIHHMQSPRGNNPPADRMGGLMAGKAAWLALLLTFLSLLVVRAEVCHELHATTVSVGDVHTCVVLTDGSVRCWGDSEAGRLGPDNITTPSDPTGTSLQFGAQRSVSQLAVHPASACALLDDGSVACWGANDQGELGIANHLLTQSQPKQLQLGTGNATVQQISTGCCSYHSCAAIAGEGVACWGTASGLEGTPWVKEISIESNFAVLPSFIDLGSGSSKQLTVLGMCSGYFHTCVLTVQLGLQCWGVTAHGQLGLGKITNTTNLAGAKLRPVNLGTGRLAVQISCGLYHTCAMLDNGTLRCWGDNTSGQLGYGDTISRGANDTDMGDNLKPVDVGTGRTVQQVVAGADSTCAILDNGDLKCWGDDTWGQLGRNCSTGTWGSEPADMGDNLIAINLGPNRTAVSVSISYGAHTCAVLDDGTVKCWGRNDYGQLGFSTSTNLTCSPSAVVELGNNCISSPVVVSNSTAAGSNSTGGGSSNSTGGGSSNNSTNGVNNSTASGNSSTGTGSNSSNSADNTTGSGSNSTPLLQQAVSSTSSSHSVSGGTTAGVVVACVVAVALIGAAGWWLRKKQGSSRQLAGVTGAVAVGSKQQSAGVVVVASDEAVVNGLEEGLVHTTVDDQQQTGCCTWPSRSTTSTTPDAKGTSNSHNTPSTGAASPGLMHEGSVEDMRISWSDLIVGRVLGEGGFGTVYKARWQSETVAVKLLSVRKTSTAAISNLYNEALIMSRLRHPCIARVFGVVDEDPHHALVMQYYPKGTLAKYMTTAEYARLQFPIKLHIARQIASGMRFMHERPVPILHGDLKAANILLTGPGRQIAIADFGLSQAMLAGQEAAVASGALTYSISPPEVLDDPLASRTSAADVYAFAIVLLEIYTGKRAFGNLWPKDIRMMVTSGGRPPLPADMPVCIATIIQSCWAQDPAARPSFKVVAKQLTAAYEDLHLTHMIDGTKTVDGTQTMTDW